MTFDEIVDEIAARLNVRSSDSETRIGRAVNRIYRSVTTATGLNTTRHLVGEPSVIALGESTAEWTGVEKIFRVYMVPLDSSRVTNLDEITFLQMREEPYRTGTPTRWAVQTTDATSVVIRFNSEVEMDTDVYADCIGTAATLVTTAVPIIPESFHDILIEGVLRDEYRKMNDTVNYQMSRDIFEQRMGDLKYFLAKSAYLEIYQGANAVPPRFRRR